MPSRRYSSSSHVGARLEALVEEPRRLRGGHAEHARAAGGAAPADVVPLAAAVDEQVGLDGAPADALGALGPVLDVQQAALDDGRVDGVEHVVGGKEEVAAHQRRRRALAGAAELGGGAGQSGARSRGQLAADELDGQQERVGLQRRQARRAREGGPGELARDAQLRAALVLGVEQGAVAAEVDQVEQADVGAQLFGGDPEGGADGGDVEQRLVVAAALQKIRGERREAREAVDLHAPVVGRAAPAAPAGGRVAAGGPQRRRLRRFRVEQAVEAAELRRQPLAQLGRLQELRRVGEPEQPAEQRPRVRVGRAVHDAAVLVALDGCHSAPSAPRPTRPSRARRGCAPCPPASRAARRAGRGRRRCRSPPALRSRAARAWRG